MIDWIVDVFESIIEWFKETFSFVDAELLMMIGIAIMSIILLKLVFKALYRYRILKVLVAVGVIAGLLFMALHYVDTHKELFSNQTNFYVYGRAGFISNTVRTLELESTKSNFYKGGEGRVVVKVPATAKIIDSKGKELKLNELSQGDVLQVYCKESSIGGDSDEVTAVKIVRKYEN